MRPYTRSLDPQDYEFLPHAVPLRLFQETMTVPHNNSHLHKIWENASILQQLEELQVPRDARIIDVGSGGMFFPPYLSAVAGYKNLELTDSMGNMDIMPMVAAQCEYYGISMPTYALKAESMSVLQSEAWDVVMCISTIEHIDADQHDNALREIWRLAKPGGLIFLTSDYFKSSDGQLDREQHRASPYRDGQLTAYHKEFVLNLPNIVDVEFIGDTDLDYRGDFVHNYSFVNVCMRKPLRHPLQP